MSYLKILFNRQTIRFFLSRKTAHIISYTDTRRKPRLLRKYYISNLLLIFFLSTTLQIYAEEWRPYDIYKCGAKGLGAGGAFTAVADDVSASYWNPAGLIQIQKPTLYYNMDAQIRIITLIDTSLKLTYKFPSLLGFVMPLQNNSTIGINIDTPIQRKIPYELAVYGLSILYAFPITEHLFVGIKPSINYATYGKANSPDGWGVSIQAGILYFFTKRLHFGLNYHSKISINWGTVGRIIKLKETFPDVLSFGVAYLLTEELIMDLDIEYQNWRGIKYIADGTDLAPVDKIETGLCKTIHPHIGLLFLETKSGAHLRTGLSTEYYLHEKGNGETQLLWSIGVGAYAFKIIKFEATLADNYLMHFIHSDNNRIETIQITAEYRF